MRKMIYHSWHRGTRENDLLLGPFADTQLPSLSPALRQAYQHLLNQSDAQIFAWIAMGQPVPALHTPIVSLIRQFHGR